MADRPLEDRVAALEAFVSLLMRQMRAPGRSGERDLIAMMRDAHELQANWPESTRAALNQIFDKMAPGLRAKQDFAGLAANIRAKGKPKVVPLRRGGVSEHESSPRDPQEDD